MACRLVALDKIPRVFPLGIGEILHRDIAKFFLMAAGDKVKVACGNLKLCAGIESGIEGAMNDVWRRREQRGVAHREMGKETGKEGT